MSQIWNDENDDKRIENDKKKIEKEEKYEIDEKYEIEDVRGRYESPIIELPETEIRGNILKEPSIIGSISDKSSELFGHNLKEFNTKGLKISTTEDDSDIMSIEQVRKDDIMDEDIDISIDISDDKNKKLKKKKKKMTSSEEQTMEHQMTRLSDIFFIIIKNEFIKNNLNELHMIELFKNQNKINKLTKRDVARGFMQTLILKNADLINVNQNESYGNVIITKQPSFDDYIPNI